MLSNKNAPHPKYAIPTFILGIVLFLLILNSRYPYVFRPAIIQARSGFSIPVLVLFLSLLLILSKNNWYNRSGLFILIVIVFAMALAGLWASGQSERQVINGIIPDTDAAFYYYDGLRLQNGLPFSYFGARRIFFPAFLGVLMSLTQSNLQITLGVLTFLMAISAYLATSVVWKHFGSLAASIFFILLFTFARLSIGKVMSECLGLTLGCLSLYFYLSYSSHKQFIHFFLASVTLVLGLLTRAGSLGIYPMLVLGIYLQEKDKSTKKKILLISILSILIVILSFSTLSSQLSPDNSIPFSNFAHTLYGIASGGKGWIQIYKDYPELKNVSEPGLTKLIYEYSFQAIKSNPKNFIYGIFSQFPQIFNFPGRDGFFSYFGGENSLLYNISQISLFSLSFFSIYILKKKKQYEKYKYFLYGLIGVLLFVPFFPFVDFNKMRVYATVIPFINIFPAIGLKALFDTLSFAHHPRKAQEEEQLKPVKSPVIFTIYLLLMIMAAPILYWKMIPDHVVASTDHCQPEDQSLVVKLSEGSYIGLLEESVIYLDWLPYYHESQFEKYLHNFQIYTVQAFEKVSAPSFITSSIDIRDGQAVIIIFEDEKMAYNDEPLLICGQWDDYDYSDFNANVFYVHEYFRY